MSANLTAAGVITHGAVILDAKYDYRANLYQEPDVDDMDDFDDTTIYPNLPHRVTDALYGLCDAELTWADLTLDVNPLLALIKPYCLTQWPKVRQAAPDEMDGLSLKLVTPTSGTPSLFFPDFQTHDKFLAFMDDPHSLDNMLQGMEDTVRELRIVYADDAPNLGARPDPPFKPREHALLRKSEEWALYREALLWGRFWAQHGFNFNRLTNITFVMPKPMLFLDSTILGYLTHPQLSWKRTETEYQGSRCVMVRVECERIYNHAVLFSNNMRVALPNTECEYIKEHMAHYGWPNIEIIPKHLKKRLPLNPAEKQRRRDKKLARRVAAARQPRWTPNELRSGRRRNSSGRYVSMT
ncbi:hypothetical protein EJ05DRAFT_506999 [Pseudovirgaria hyperparasitica]|uniref:Uncharacterized protein n=1 Tax=Pseudovirgaria hyperparasitica TaxID=470096 RepID=A0A6A6WMM5_9PEZI|nr:uncharacterized protein EJ05DRAFT_506999 [Pseudovirgaria hyperparasitica]KAF2763398.1 hypothetical protein EJ05DRAFT_506999 [Pseudovirgaria hyperparasitica]